MHHTRDDLKFHYLFICQTNKEQHKIKFLNKKINSKGKQFAKKLKPNIVQSVEVHMKVSENAWDPRYKVLLHK